MATFTPKLNLEKPLGTEFYNVTGVQNVNSDKIDSFAIDIENKKFSNVGTTIPNLSDLDNYKTCGHYKCASSFEAGGILNNPFGAKAFTLVVDSISGNGSYVLQTAYSLYNEVKTRYFIAEGFNTWYPWVTALSEKDVINNLISTSTTQPLSAGQGKQLQDTKLSLTGGTLSGALNGTTATFSGNVTAPNIITNTSIGTCTTLFSGTQQCGQNTWKDTGIDIPTTYSSVLIGVNHGNSGIYDTESEFSRCTLTRGQTLLFSHPTQYEYIMGKIIGDRLWTYTNNSADNNLKTVIGITRR